MQGVIVRSPQIRLADFEGEYSYLGTTLRQANIEPMPSLSDVRRLVTEFGILPLGENLCHRIRFEPRHDKTNVMRLRPAWIKTSLHICAVWSGSMLFTISFSTCNSVCKWTAWILIWIHAGGKRITLVLLWHGSFV
jgi:hypothetical protein